MATTQISPGLIAQYPWLGQVSPTSLQSFLVQASNGTPLFVPATGVVSGVPTAVVTPVVAVSKGHGTAAMICLVIGIILVLAGLIAFFVRRHNTSSSSTTTTTSSSWWIWVLVVLGILLIIIAIILWVI